MNDMVDPNRSDDSSPSSDFSGKLVDYENGDEMFFIRLVDGNSVTNQPCLATPQTAIIPNTVAELIGR